MAIEHADVLRAAHLARLGIDNTDAERYVGDLSRILDMVDALSGIDTKGVKPLAHPLDATQPLRADEAIEPNRRDTYQESAPAVADGYYLVPRVVE